MSGDDIVQRLRRWDGGISTHWVGCFDSHPVCAIRLAADAIEARDAKIKRLRDEVDIKECRVETLSNQIEQLRAELDAVTDLRSQMTIILHRIGVALYGEEPDIGWWSWHDLPERAAAERALADQMARALAAVKADRPTAHTHEVWTAVCDALDDYGKARREQ